MWCWCWFLRFKLFAAQTRFQQCAAWWSVLWATTSARYLIGSRITKWLSLSLSSGATRFWRGWTSGPWLHWSLSHRLYARHRWSLSGLLDIIIEVIFLTTIASSKSKLKQPWLIQIFPSIFWLFLPLDLANPVWFPDRPAHHLLGDTKLPSKVLRLSFFFPSSQFSIFEDLQDWINELFCFWPDCLSVSREVVSQFFTIGNFPGFQLSPGLKPWQASQGLPLNANDFFR